MASLLTLPLELLVSISSYLPTSDLASLRLTCKQAEKSLYEWFSQEFFTKKQFMLTHSSLQALIDISKHVSFSKKLTHVIIATNVYDETPFRFRDEDAAKRYMQGYESQKSLLSTGVDREMLSEAFSNLVNLHTVGIRDFNAPRPRDGKGATWSSWGASTAYRETGIELQFSDRGSYMHEIGSRFVSRVFASVLYALGKVDRKPAAVEVLLRKDGLPDVAFSLPNFLRPTVQPVLETLTALLLNLDLSSRSFHTHSNGTMADAFSGRSLRHFLACTPNLTHLRLNFSKQAMSQNHSFLTWLSQPIPAADGKPASFLEPLPVDFPYLKRLDLGQLNASFEVVAAIIEKFASTLEDISLWRMGLHSVTLPPSTDYRPNYWAALFKTLRKMSDLKLKHFKVGMLNQDHMHVNFQAEDPDEITPLKVMEYTGKEMDGFLAKLVKRVFVFWPEIVSVTDTEESDADEDMGDEDSEEDEDSENEDDDDEDED